MWFRWMYLCEEDASCRFVGGLSISCTSSARGVSAAQETTTQSTLLQEVSDGSFLTNYLLASFFPFFFISRGIRGHVSESVLDTVRATVRASLF